MPIVRTTGNPAKSALACEYVLDAGANLALLPVRLRSGLLEERMAARGADVDDGSQALRLKFRLGLAER